MVFAVQNCGNSHSSLFPSARIAPNRVEFNLSMNLRNRLQAIVRLFRQLSFPPSFDRFRGRLRCSSTAGLSLLSSPTLARTWGGVKRLREGCVLGPHRGRACTSHQLRNAPEQRRRTAAHRASRHAPQRPEVDGECLHRPALARRAALAAARREYTTPSRGAQ